MTDTIEQISLGQRLKNGREALGLTLEDVAQKTNLKRNHIESLENDIFILQNVPPAFVRGYVRNYVRFLRLPEELVQSANYGEVTIPKEVRKAAPIKVSNNQKSQTRWVKLLTTLILLGAIGMTLAWWWQEHKKDEMSRAEIVEGNNTVDISQPMQAETASTEQGTLPVISTNSETEQSNAAQAVITAPTEEKVETPAVVESTQAAEAAKEPEKQEVVTTETTETAADTANAAVGNDELRIEINGGQSWITVRSPKAKRSLAEKLYNNGEVLTFNNNEQYRLTIGAPANVKIYYKGQQIPLKVDGRVARIKLPQ